MGCMKKGKETVYQILLYHKAILMILTCLLFAIIMCHTLCYTAG